MSQGHLDAFRVFKLLRGLLEKRASGVLRLSDGSLKIETRFAYGQPVNVWSNSPEHGLGPALVESGLISSTELRDVMNESLHSSESVASVVVREDLVAKGRLKRLEARLARLRFLDAFNIQEGHFSFDSGGSKDAPLIDPIHPVELIIDACGSVMPTPLCSRFLKQFPGQQLFATPWLEEHRAYFESAFPVPNMLPHVSNELRADKIHLLPGDRARNVREACALILSGMCGLVAAGSKVTSTQTMRHAQNVNEADVTVPRPPPAPPLKETKKMRVEDLSPSNDPDKTTPAPETAKAETPKKRHSNSLRPSAGPVVRPPNVRSKTIVTAPPESLRPPEVSERPTAKPARPERKPAQPSRPAARHSGSGNRKGEGPSKRPPARSGPSRESTPPSPGNTAGVQVPKDMPERDKEFLNQALELAKTVDSMTHYELLDLEMNASGKMVRHRFRKLARQFHVDRFSRYALTPETRNAVQKVFIALNRAHETLHDPSERQEYDLGLEFERSAEERTGVKRNPQDKNARLQDALRAEKQVQVAIALLARGDASGALENLDKALLVTPEEPSAQSAQAYARYLVAQSQGSSSTVASQSVSILQKVVAKHRNLAEPQLYLGRLLRDRGDLEGAVKAFKEALRINPHMSEAHSELRYAQKRTQKPDAGGLRGLFGRKK